MSNRRTIRSDGAFTAVVPVSTLPPRPRVEPPGLDDEVNRMAELTGFPPETVRAVLWDRRRREGEKEIVLLGIPYYADERTGACRQA